MPDVQMPDQMPEEPEETSHWEEQKGASTAQQGEDKEETRKWEDDKGQVDNDA